MAGRKAGLITGSNAKIVLGGRTIAYATDIQYAVETTVIPVETMGRYEVVSHEPVAVSVSGSFTVVRYAKDLAVTATLPGASTTGNGTGQLASGSTPASDGNMGGAFNPAQILANSTVDIAIFQKLTANASNNADAGGTVQQVVKVTDCTLTSMGGSVNKRGILQEGYRFVGILLQDDSFNFTQAASGVGPDLG
jgi:hypothetical protein